MLLTYTQIKQALILATRRCNEALEHGQGFEDRHGKYHLECAKLVLEALSRLPLNKLTQDELYNFLTLAIEKIEAAGASIQLTHAVILVSDLSAAIGNRWNQPQDCRAQMVRQLL